MKKVFLPLLAVLAMGTLLSPIALASPSEQFYRRGVHLFDDWGIFRTRANGTDGFLSLTSTDFFPIIARESLGENVDVAWDLGQELAQKYPDRNQRAERIFYFVRDRVRYTSDTDQFDRGEFAQNADEVAETIVEEGAAKGDCEDSAVLLAVMYKAAGYRSAMVLAPGHVATLVHLPGYKKAPRKLTLAGEDGWVWAEATGATNPFGWVPESVISEDMIASEVTVGQIEGRVGGGGAATVESGSSGEGTGTASMTGLLTLLGVVGLLWFITGGRGRTGRVVRRR